MGFQYLYVARSRQAPYPMVLCVLAPRPLTILPGQLIAKAIRFIFIRVYHRRKDDELLQQNLRIIPDEIVLTEPLAADPTASCC